MRMNGWQIARQTLLAALASVLVVPTVLAQDEEKSQQEGIGYFLGISIGQQMSSQGFKQGDFDIPAMARGLADALAGKEPQMSEDQIRQVAQAIEGLLTQRQEADAEKMQSVAVSNLEKSELFLAENSKKDGVKQIAEGLHYETLTEGSGESPTADDTVRVHYTGRLISGKVFDSSVERGTPAVFPVGGVIKGWQTALQEMKVGDKWKLFIHPKLAYGARGTPAPPGAEPDIGPNEALIFEVELLDIVK